MHKTQPPACIDTAAIILKLFPRWYQLLPKSIPGFLRKTVDIISLGQRIPQFDRSGAPWDINIFKPAVFKPSLQQFAPPLHRPRPAIPHAQWRQVFLCKGPEYALKYVVHLSQQKTTPHYRCQRTTGNENTPDFPQNRLDIVEQHQGHMRQNHINGPASQGQRLRPLLQQQDIIRQDISSAIQIVLTDVHTNELSRKVALDEQTQQMTITAGHIEQRQGSRRFERDRDQDVV